jgi:predicted mannosyl-3-phosphoglycerate phosphatase (HAD superfamily)
MHPLVPKVPAAVKLIVSDVDGTLLNSIQQLNPAVEVAIKEAAISGVPVSFEPCHTRLLPASYASNNLYDDY